MFDKTVRPARSEDSYTNRLTEEAKGEEARVKPGRGD